jgi:hypothetical protein
VKIIKSPGPRVLKDLSYTVELRGDELAVLQALSGSVGGGFEQSPFCTEFYHTCGNALRRDIGKFDPLTAVSNGVWQDGDMPNLRFEVSK